MNKPEPEETLHTTPDLEEASHTMDTTPSGQASSRPFPDPPDPLSENDALRYQTKSLHAKGGLGEVHKAEDTELHRTVALKRIRSEHLNNHSSQQRFLIEAEITARLEHPGIVPIYGLIQTDNGPSYAMRFIEGESLGDAIKQYHQSTSTSATEQRLAFRNLLGRLIDVCNTMAYAHGRGVIHRDLKPDNIMLGKYGETLVVDWGLAKIQERKEETSVADEKTIQLNHQKAESEQTQLGNTVGTPSYMSPEQAAGRWDILDHRSDNYALGAILYALLTGHAPVQGNNVAEILQRVQQGEFPRPIEKHHSVPKPLQAVCLKAMALKPENRYDTALEIASELERWLADESVHAYREPLTQRSWRWVRHHKAIVSSLFVLILTALVGVSVGYFLVDQEKRKVQRAEEESSRLGQLSLETINQVVDGFQEDLKKMPVARTLRHHLLKLALTRVEQLGEQLVNSKVANRTTLIAHLELGDIFFQAGVANEMDPDEESESKSRTNKALWHFQQGLEIADKLAKQSSGDIQAQRDLALVQERMGKTVLELGDVPKAHRYYFRSHTLIKQLAEREPANLSTQRDLSVSYQHLAEVNIRSGKLDEAKSFIEKMYNIMKMRFAQLPNDVTVQEDLIIALNKLGDISLRLNNAQKAQEYYFQAWNLAKNLAQQNKDNSKFQRELSVCQNKLGEVSLLLKDTQTAHQYYKDALEIRKTLAQQDPENANAQRDLSLAFENIGNVSVRLNQSSIAQQYYEQALEIRKKLAHQDPENVRLQRDVVAAHERLGTLLRSSDIQTAKKHFLQAHTLLQDLLQNGPTDVSTQQALSVSHERLGNVSLTLKDTQSAISHFERALEIAKKVHQQVPEDISIQTTLANSHSELGHVYLKVEKLNKAQDHFEQALTIRKERAKNDPRNWNAQRALASSHAALGELNTVLKKKQLARKHFLKMNGILQEHVQQDPDNAKARMELSHSYSKLGMVSFMWNNLQEAQQYYQECLNISEQLSANNPDNVKLLDDLASHLNDLGAVTLALGQTDKAKEYFLKSLAIREQRLKQIPNDIQTQLSLVISYYRLASVYKQLREYPLAEKEFNKALSRLENIDKQNEGKLFKIPKYAFQAKDLRQNIAMMQLIQRAIQDIRTALNQQPGQVVYLLTERMLYFAQKKQHHETTITANKLVELFPKRAASLYNAASAFSLSASQVSENKPLSEQYAQRALELLLLAVKAGYSNINHIKTNTGLNAIRQRDQFKQILNELNKK